MSILSANKAYQNNSFQTASPGELTLMLYNGCLKFIGLARTAIENKNIEGKNTNLLKAQNIIKELMVTLNMDQEVSKSMMQMYDYINRRLVEVNLHNNVEILDEIEDYVTDFRNTWKEVIQINRRLQHGETGRV
ncbi:flagellar export chaperone FliS [Bacillus sp. NEB1478]|uniref:flagellar export chaperone FliS n=1 Tax=Bacillus sp. NEB1478 TaxID=3073816 RepID=UPI00287374D2|nr:flagellar export chaperone FliS [Bacillus sp. NEB1478]WNB92738.1 flagellar export chaperone FliS [Bacillus sp. NEB1478]